jgi:hypothetical protein
VLKKLAELAHATSPRHVAVRDGTRLPVLDGEAEVRVMPGANRVRWVGEQLVLEARAEADLGQLAMRALQKRALAHFGERLARYCGLLGLADAQAQPVLGAYALGQLQQARRHPHQLAPDPPADPSWRLCGGARSGPPAAK